MVLVDNDSNDDHGHCSQDPNKRVHKDFETGPRGGGRWRVSVMFPWLLKAFG